MTEATHTAGAILRLLDRPVAEGDLAAAALLVSRPAEARAAAMLGLLLFRIGDETAALPAKLLQRVTGATCARPIPHRSSGILRGLCNIRGELVLCADLHRLLGIEREGEAADARGAAGDSRRMVVIGASSDSWAFEVDALIGIERIDATGVRPPPITVARALGAFTEGVMEIEGRRVTVLDGDRVLAGFRASLQ